MSQQPEPTFERASAPDMADATTHSLVSVGRNAAYLASAAAVAQVLAMARELFLAAQVGISGNFDALLIALGLPVLLANVFINGTGTALVPAFTELRESRGLNSARRLAGTILCWAALIGCVITVLLYVMADGVISIVGPGLSPTNHDAAVGYLRFLSPLALVTVISGVLYAVCQAEEGFRAIAVANLLGPLVTLVMLVVMWAERGLWALAVGSLMGPIVTGAMLLLGTYRCGAVPRLSIASSGEALEVVRHAVPLTVSSGIGLLSTVGDKAIATLLFPGAVSALRYADVLVRIPVGVVGPAWSSAIYPALVRAAQGRGASKLGSTAGLALRYALVVFVPVSAFVAAAAPIGVTIAYGRGSFTSSELVLVSQMVAAYSPLVVLLMTAPVLTSSLNAKRRGTIVLAGGALNVTLNLVLDVVLGLTLGVLGLAAAPAISSAIATLFFAWRLGRLDASLDTSRIWRTLRMSVIAAAPATLVTGGFVWGFWSFEGLLQALATLTLIGVATAGIDLRLAGRLKIAEVSVLIELLLARTPGRLRSTMQVLVGHSFDRAGSTDH